MPLVRLGPGQAARQRETRKYCLSLGRRTCVCVCGEDPRPGLMLYRGFGRFNYHGDIVHCFNGLITCINIKPIYYKGVHNTTQQELKSGQLASLT